MKIDTGDFSFVVNERFKILLEAFYKVTIRLPEEYKEAMESKNIDRTTVSYYIHNLDVEPTKEEFERMLSHMGHIIIYGWDSWINSMMEFKKMVEEEQNEAVKEFIERNSENIEKNVTVEE